MNGPGAGGLRGRCWEMAAQPGGGHPSIHLLTAEAQPPQQGSPKASSGLPSCSLRLPPGVAPPLIKQQRWPRQPHRVLELLLIGVLSSLRPTGPVVTHVREPGREARGLTFGGTQRAPALATASQLVLPLLRTRVSPGSPPAAVAAPARSAPTTQAPRLHLPPHSFPPLSSLSPPCSGRPLSPVQMLPLSLPLRCLLGSHTPRFNVHLPHEIKSQLLSRFRCFRTLPTRGIRRPAPTALPAPHAPHAPQAPRPAHPPSPLHLMTSDTCEWQFKGNILHKVSAQIDHC